MMHAELTAVDPAAAVIGEIEALALPLWAPWPLPPDWTFTGMAVGRTPQLTSQATSQATSEATAGDVGPTRVIGTVSTWCGPDPIGDPTEVLLVCEEAGIGIGSYFAGLEENYPDAGVGEGPPHARFSLHGHPVLLWSVETRSDRAAFVGEAAGRWFWLVVHPGEASFVVVQPWQLVDARQLGAELAVLPVGAMSPRLVLSL